MCIVRSIVLALLGLGFFWQFPAYAKGYDQRQYVQKKTVSQRALSDPYEHDVITYFGGTPIITSPYLGLRSEFDGSELIVNLPSINEDLRLLQHRYYLDSYLLKRYKKLPEHPLIELSGKVAGLIAFQSPYRGHTRNFVDLSGAELDVVVHAHEWITGFLALEYDGSRDLRFENFVSNSRIFLDKGFVTVGNLLYGPFYFTVGQLYVPFGRYSSSMLSAPLTLRVGRTKERTLIVGFTQPGGVGWFGNVFYFKGDTVTRGQNNGGAHLGYNFNTHGVKGEVGGSVLLNLGDAIGFQRTGGDVFQGFAVDGQRLHHPIPALHVYSKAGYRNVGFILEYVTALRHFDPLDLSFNHHGAKPWALNAEGGIRFLINDKPAAVAIAYGRSQDALALQLPRDRVTASFHVSIWRDTIESLEIRHSSNYGCADRASGQSKAVSTDTLGRRETVVTAQISLFF